MVNTLDILYRCPSLYDFMTKKFDQVTVSLDKCVISQSLTVHLGVTFYRNLSFYQHIKYIYFFKIVFYYLMQHS